MEEPPKSSNAPKTKTPKQQKNRSSDHTFKKRRPNKPDQGPNVIYVSTKTSIKALTERCGKLIDKGESEIVLYCLGAAIQRGILLALKLCEEYVAFSVETNTFTTELTDDLEPAVDDADYKIQRRNNSALKLRLFRQKPIVA